MVSEDSDVFLKLNEMPEAFELDGGVSIVTPAAPVSDLEPHVGISLYLKKHWT